MTSPTDNQQTIFYTLVAVLTTVALILVMCKQSGTAAAVSSVSVLMIVVMLCMQQGGQGGAVVVELPSSTSSSSKAVASKKAVASAAKKVKSKRAAQKAADEAAEAEEGQAEEQAEAAAEEPEEVQPPPPEPEEPQVPAEEAEQQSAGEETQEVPVEEEAVPVEQEAAPVEQEAVPVAATSARRATSVAARRPKKKPSARYSANQVADVPGNEYVGVPAPKFYMKEPPRMTQECSSAKLVLPITMEGETPFGWRPEDYGGDNLTSCSGGIQTVPPMPPMPGLALPPPPGESIWRLPENVVDQCSREESIAAVVSGLPTCCQQTPMEAIRNQGLYGVKGNLSCDKLKRSAVADFNLLEPLGARNAFLAYNSYDQLHAKDQFLIPINKNQPE
jgi:hypothetical protein